MAHTDRGPAVRMLARALYEQHRSGRHHEGPISLIVPAWDDLNPATESNWEQAAEALLRRIGDAIKCSSCGATEVECSGCAESRSIADMVMSR